MKQFGWQVYYTSAVGEELAKGGYAALFTLLPDLVDPDVKGGNEQRVALYETLRKLDPEIRAMEDFIMTAGNPTQKAQMETCMSAYHEFMRDFDPDLPPETLLQSVLRRFGKSVADVRAYFQQLISAAGVAVANLDDTFNLKNLLTDDRDKVAREITKRLLAEGLQELPTSKKVKLINELLDGFTESDDEQCILDILRATKARNKDEFYQIIAAVGYEKLDFSIDWEENDELKRLMNET
jgi:hypothetical protein